MEQEESLIRSDLFEKAESEGLRVFPDNPIGAALVKKSFLEEPMTEEEENTLMDLIQKKQYDPEVLELFKRSREHDPLSALVEVNNGTTLHVSPEETNKKIWTYGLGRCNATLTFIETKGGVREIILTHFFPDKIKDQASKIAKLFSAVDTKNIQKAKTVIFALGRKNGDELEIENAKNTDILTAMILSQTPQTTIECIPYPPFQNRLSGTKNQGVLIADIPGSLRGDATYQTWFTNGKLS